MTVKHGTGLSREEHTLQMWPAEAEILFRACEGTILEKRRYQMGRWEIDVYEGALAGLVVAEIELASEDEAPPPVPAGVTLGEEMTGNSYWKNSSLAQLGTSAAKATAEEYRAAF
jgi:CYTH domain-containing protein